MKKCFVCGKFKVSKMIEYDDSYFCCYDCREKYIKDKKTFNLKRGYK